MLGSCSNDNDGGGGGGSVHTRESSIIASDCDNDHGEDKDGGSGDDDHGEDKTGEGGRGQSRAGGSSATQPPGWQLVQILFALSTACHNVSPSVKTMESKNSACSATGLA